MCSQGHLEILKLLVNFNKVPSKSPDNSAFFSTDAEKLRVFTGGANSEKYLSMFDLNSLDVNDQSGLYAAVVANKYDICEYLINMRVKKLTQSDLIKIQQQEDNKQKEKLKTSESSGSISLFTSLISSLSNEEMKHSNSFFDHLKNVFLDPKPTPPCESLLPSNLIDIDSSKKSQAETRDTTEPDIYFNPININEYSKFGSTCLHEAIRNKNYLLVNLLLNNGANANLPIYDMHSGIIHRFIFIFKIHCELFLQNRQSKIEGPRNFFCTS